MILSFFFFPAPRNGTALLRGGRQQRRADGHAERHVAVRGAAGDEPPVERRLDAVADRLSQGPHEPGEHHAEQPRPGGRVRQRGPVRAALGRRTGLLEGRCDRELLD